MTPHQHESLLKRLDRLCTAIERQNEIAVETQAISRRMVDITEEAQKASTVLSRVLGAP